MINKTPEDLAKDMKRDWDERACEDAKWYINCAKHGQTEEEFDTTGLAEVRRFVTSVLTLLVGDRDPHSVRMLEIGCGIGRMTKHLAGMFGEVHATDVSAEMIRQARERLQPYPNVHLYETNGSDFAELPDESFDLIFSAYVFQHVPSKEIILSNIRDAYRLLKPGGTFKFAVTGLENREYLKMPKDTWTGAPVFEEEIRLIVGELGAHLTGLAGMGTQYFWTLLRKPLHTQTRDERQPTARPKIIDAGVRPCFIDIGRQDEFGNGESYSREGRTFTGIIVEGLDPEELDVNQLIVELRGKEILPCFAGPAEDGSTEHFQVDFPIPEDDPGSTANVRLRNSEGVTSDAFTLVQQPRQTMSLKIHFVSNFVDGGLDVYTEGPKSKIRIHTEGLNKEVTIENLRLHLGMQTIKPQSISFVPNNGLWLVIAQLPEDTLPGKTEIRLTYNNLASPSLPLHINMGENTKQTK
jgi:SAM-dependent methyltransferase